jgi:hypothetical protein
MKTGIGSVQYDVYLISLDQTTGHEDKAMPYPIA